MKKIVFIIPFLLPIWLLSQGTVINVYGVVQSYAEDDCGGIITLDDASAFSNNSLAVIIQMQGATINEGNNSSFGTITQLGSTGFYELIQITEISGNQVSIASSLLNTYDYSASVQLVSLPEYESVGIADELTGTPWNGSKGGVIALKADRIDLNAGINADGLGFRGGVADIAVSNNCSSFTNANNYWYELSNWRGAQKGEGIARIISGKESGRGPQANGGGGANDHNAGGGGGANITSGGQGGENREPSFFGCDGNFPGFGGKAITGTNNRIFFGGGGGAGHENNDVGTNGGRGGGIVIIIAEEFHGNNQIVSANGDAALTTSGSDGAGGGGGGGTVILLSTTADGVNIEANGGNGGDSNNSNADRCTGPGGGGSGGRILSNLNIAEINYALVGGAPGESINSASCPASPNGAQGGQDGVLEALVAIPQNESEGVAPSFESTTMEWQICEGQPLVLSPDFEGEDLSFQWEINTGTGFIPLVDNEVYQGVTSAVLTINTPVEEMQGFEYHLILMSACFTSVTSDAISFEVDPLATAMFSASINGLEVMLINSSENADAYLWNFGDGSSSSLPAPEHVYENGGTYTLSLTVTNGCGSHTMTQVVEIGVAPIAGFSNSHSGGCAPLSINFFNESTGDYDTIEWSFPGGTPAFSSEEAPIVTYDTPGTYSVTLVVSGGVGESTITSESVVTVTVEPTSSFVYEVVAPNVVSFQNTSENANFYNWNFGDGTSSTEENPTHEFPMSGVYEVSLNAQNDFCGTAVSESIMLLTSVMDVEEKDFRIFPNPVKNELNIISKQGLSSVQVFDYQGRFVFKKEINLTLKIDVSFLKNGVYYLVLPGSGGPIFYKLIKIE